MTGCWSLGITGPRRLAIRAAKFYLDLGRGRDPAGLILRSGIWGGPRRRSWRRWSRPSRALSLLVQNLAGNRHSEFGKRGVVSIDEQQTFIGPGVHIVGVKGDGGLVPVALRSALPFQLQSR